MITFLLFIKLINEFKLSGSVGDYRLGPKYGLMSKNDKASPYRKVKETMYLLRVYYTVLRKIYLTNNSIVMLTLLDIKNR
ncbi:hypothetical protein BML2537_30610 [Providencia stuartii]|nr:hypothetical protein BML2537_30610 [Providencia stuartii]GHB81125.1 hypothetical protein GCM10007290_00700 [Providencia thailandensis]